MKMKWLTLFLLAPVASMASSIIDIGAAPAAGRSTYYTATTTVACDIPSSAWPQYVAALSEPQFLGGLACGSTARIVHTPAGSTTPNTIDVMVVDLCPTADNKQWCSGDTTHFDLMGSTTFAVLDKPVIGVLHSETFQWIPTPTTGNIQIRIKDSSGYPWYAPIQVYNARYPITSVEVSNDNGVTWTAGDRTQAGLWNWWVLNFSPGLSVPFEVRVTDQYGQQIIDTVTSGAAAGATIPGTVQFPVYNNLIGTPVLPTENHSGFSVQGSVLHMSGAQLPAQIDVVNLMGSQVFHATVPQGDSYILPSMLPGIYLLKVTGQKGETLFSAKLVR